MEEILASVDHLNFDVEAMLDEQLGAIPLPFPGMDKSSSAVCVFHLRGTCSIGTQCPYRHVRGDRTVVCKHWLRGLCKKGDMCEFLHEFDMTKMPECYFYSRFHACTNKECPFQHVDPESKRIDCPWYDRGFCRHGPTCRHRHVRRVLCLNYLCGFCPEGANCKQVHPRFDIPGHDLNKEEVGGAASGALATGTGGGVDGGGRLEGFRDGSGDGTMKAIGGSGIGGWGRGPRPLTCHGCGEAGHKIYRCPKLTQDKKEEIIAQKQQQYQDYQQQKLGSQSQNHHPPHHQNHQEVNIVNGNEVLGPRGGGLGPGGGGLGPGGGGLGPGGGGLGPGGGGMYSGNNPPPPPHGQAYNPQRPPPGGPPPSGPPPLSSMPPGFDPSNGGPQSGTFQAPGQYPGPRRSLDQVTCFKCGERGHYANRCPKGHLAFLSSSLRNIRPPLSGGGGGGLGSGPGPDSYPPY